ncbi:MAG: PAS domain S-box protein [Deltaproteobacteria bacterium]|nr:MAG: PAS domain S-box protein [Deltaproteobacteria bacterium]
MISQLKKAGAAEREGEKAIREEAQALLTAIVESSDDAIISKTLDGTVTSWNSGAERLFGYTAQEMIGKSIMILIPPERHDEERLILERLRRGERIEHYETVRVAKSGRAVDISLTISPIRNSSGRIIGASKVARDITLWKHAQEALRESEEKLRRQAQELEQQLIASGRLVSLGEITASMAHEFNNPLGIVMGFTQDLLSETDPSSPSYRSLKIIDEETKRCEKIIRNLLQFARPRATEVSQTDIRQLVEKTINLLANHLYKQKIEAISEIENNLPSISADPQQMEQVLVNLCLNAIDAMPEGGKLTVAAKAEPPTDGGSSTVAITVADTGFGIEERDLPKIFQPFFTAKKKRGLGLGLPICDRIIKNHGGRIKVESQPGKGTTFKVHLPLDGRP